MASPGAAAIHPHTLLSPSIHPHTASLHPLLHPSTYIPSPSIHPSIPPHPSLHTSIPIHLPHPSIHPSIRIHPPLAPCIYIHHTPSIPIEPHLSKLIHLLYLSIHPSSYNPSVSPPTHPSIYLLTWPHRCVPSPQCRIHPAGWWIRSPSTTYKTFALSCEMSHLWRGGNFALSVLISP